MMKKSSLSTKLTLSDLYNDDTIYTSRPSYVSNPWLAPEEHQSNFLTGRELLIANEMSVIVHEACVTDKLAQLFEMIGTKIPNNIYKFNDKSSYELLLQKLAHEEDKRIFFQYIHDEQILAKAYYALDKDVFVALNNKAKIPQWTNGRFLPQRQVVDIQDFEDAVNQWHFPFVIKPGDELPTAGGYGVMICYNNEDLAQAKKRVAQAKDDTNSLIIEQKIEAVANYCVQFAYSKKNGLQYIGSAEQLTNKYGFYNGNQNAQHVPEVVIEAGKEIMRNGIKEGFIGIAGFDLLIDNIGEVYAIDLNFRQNGSTSMLLLEPTLTDGYHKFYSYIAPNNNEQFFQTICKYIQKGVLFPLSYYDGDWYKDRNVSSRFGCIWHAKSKQQVKAYEQAFLNEIE